MSNNSKLKIMKSNVQITAVQKEFKNGQQGWQVFVDGMEGKLRCEMNFTNTLKAIRYCFLLSKRLDLRINDVQLAALSMSYQRAKEALAQVAEDAAQGAQEVAAKAGAAEDVPAEEVPECAPKAEEAALADSPLFKQFTDLKKKHRDALLLFRQGDFYECYEEDAVKAAEVLSLTEVRNSKDNIKFTGFPHHALDSYLPRLVRAGLRVAICDALEAPAPAKRGRKPKKAAQPAEAAEAANEELFTNA